MSKKTLIGLASLIMLPVLVVTFGIPKAFALVQGDVNPWQTSSNTLPDTLRASAGTVYNGYVYTVAGDAGSGQSNDVQFAQLNSNGTTSAWQATTSLPDSFVEPAVAAYGGHLYVMGGYNGATKNTVYIAAINNDGSVGSWTTSSNNLPYSANAATGFAHNGYLYYMGGVNFSTSYSNVRYAAINNDGSIGTWTSTTPMPDIRFRTSSFVANDRVYVLGGYNSSSNVNTVFYANLNNDGTVGGWTDSPNLLPEQVRSGGAVYNNGYAYYMGGNNGSAIVSTVSYAKIKADGSTSTWTSATNALPVALDSVTAASNGDYIYVIGGADSVGDKVDTVYYAQVAPFDPDFDGDGDGVTDVAENAGPNGGDANGDEVPDSEQAFVASFVSPVTSKYVTLQAGGGDGPSCDITSVSLAAESHNEHQDSVYDYSLGMFDFTAECPNPGDGIYVGLMYHDEEYNEDFALRKYDPNTGEYTTPEDTYIDSFDSGDESGGVVAYYYVEDGGELDTDGLMNGTIVDPAGLALVSSQAPDSGGSGSGGNTSNFNGVGVPNTGLERYWLLNIER